MTIKEIKELKTYDVIEQSISNSMLERNHYEYWYVLYHNKNEEYIEVTQGYYDFIEERFYLLAENIRTIYYDDLLLDYEVRNKAGE